MVFTRRRDVVVRLRHCELRRLHQNPYLFVDHLPDRATDVVLSFVQIYLEKLGGFGDEVFQRFHLHCSRGLTRLDCEGARTAIRDLNVVGTRRSGPIFIPKPHSLIICRRPSILQIEWPRFPELYREGERVTFVRGYFVLLEVGGRGIRIVVGDDNGRHVVLGGGIGVIARHNGADDVRPRAHRVQGAQLYADQLVRQVIIVQGGVVTESDGSGGCGWAFEDECRGNRCLGRKRDSFRGGSQRNFAKDAIGACDLRSGSRIERQRYVDALAGCKRTRNGHAYHGLRSRALHPLEVLLVQGNRYRNASRYLTRLVVVDPDRYPILRAVRCRAAADIGEGFGIELAFAAKRHVQQLIAFDVVVIDRRHDHRLRLRAHEETQRALSAPRHLPESLQDDIRCRAMERDVVQRRRTRDPQRHVDSLRTPD